MTFNLRRTLVLSVSALALIAAPVALNGLPFAPDTAAFAGNGNGNGGGGGGGDGGGNGGGSDNSNSGGGNSDHGNGGGNSDHSNRGGNDNARSSGSDGISAAPNGRSKKSSEAVETADTGEGSSSKRSLNAELAGLNSLKRNINGVMNSSDPRMDEIRQFIVASANLEEAKTAVDEANDRLADARDAYDDALADAGLVAGVTPDQITTRIGEITGELADLDPVEDAEEINELETELGILNAALDPVTAAYEDVVAANDALTEAEKAVAELGDETGPEALQEALQSAANSNRDVNDEVVAWASEQLGVGEANGLIDDYIARQ